MQLVSKHLRVVLLGGTGFVGDKLARRLHRDGHDITILSRDPARHRDSRVLPGLKLKRADVYDQTVLGHHFQKADVVVNLVGILNERGFSGKGFRKAHVELTETVLAACADAGVCRYLHMSALHAGEGSSHYLRSKGQAEALVKQAGHVAATIYRPSVIFGQGDSFINRFDKLLGLMPGVMPLAMPGARFAPVWVGDVAEAFAMGLEREEMAGQTYELCGPKAYSLREIVRDIARLGGRRTWILGLPKWASWLQAQAMDFVPGKPFSSDNYRSLQVDSVCGSDGCAALGIHPTAMEAVVPGYVGGSHHQKRLTTFRRRR